jgi:hypothetical protein
LVQSARRGKPRSVAPGGSLLETAFMVTHVVLFKLTDPAESVRRRARDVLLDMQHELPMLRSVEVGLNAGDDPRAFDVSLITRFDSMRDLEAYRVHPHHQEVIAHMKSVTSQSVVVDYET